MNIYDVLTVQELCSRNDDHEMLYVIFRTEHANHVDVAVDSDLLHFFFILWNVSEERKIGYPTN